MNVGIFLFIQYMMVNRGKEDISSAETYQTRWELGEHRTRLQGREVFSMKKFEGIKYSRIVINAIIVASVVVALTSGYKLGG